MKYVLRNKKWIAVLLCIAMLLTIAPFGPGTAFGEAGGQPVVGPVSDDGGDAEQQVIDVTDGGEIVLPYAQKLLLNVQPADSYQWQIYVEDARIWVDIAGKTESVLEISYAMVASALTDRNTTSLRCKIGPEAYTDEVAVLVVETTGDGNVIEQPSAEAVVLPSTEIVQQPVVAEQTKPEQAPAEGADTATDEPAAEQQPVVAEQTKPEQTPAEGTSTATDEPAADTTTDEAAADTVLEAPAAPVDQTSADSEQGGLLATLTHILGGAQEPDSGSSESDTDSTAAEADNGPTETAALQGSLADVESATSTPSQITQQNTGVQETYTVVINYVFANGAVAAQPWSGQIGKDTSLRQDVPSPAVVGYEATGTSMEGFTFDAGTKTVSIDIAKAERDYTYTVTYQPAEVTYTVQYYQQNVDDDQYTLVEGDTETKSGMTGTVIADVTKTYEGFTMLGYEKPVIAADGSTAVEIYFDRNYYLMNFDLDGGYGVEPIYARYGSEIRVAEPTRAGYTFAGWQLDGEPVEQLPATMPAENRTYQAVWTEGDSSFHVVYWLENADNDQYSVFGSTTVQANTGDVVNGETYRDYKGHISVDTNLQAVEPFIYYDHADADVTVAGDRSAVVNVYYKRNTYTLKFYYAMSETNQAGTNYYVVGGSTYAFGATAEIRDTADAIKLIDQYTTGSKRNQVGQVQSLPVLNANGESRAYQTGSDAAGGGRAYHYISFTAKYGADISGLWPCDVFSSVERTNGNTHDEWNSRTAFVSAWNGEHHVYYSQRNENQTIKGNYNQLDEKLLWDKERFGRYADENNTVDFLCFWENGADIEWSVPELYRYQIWVPVLDGQSTTGLTTKYYNGVTYYLRNTYDTVDDSTVASQTAPAIRGLTYKDHYTSRQITDFDKTKYREAYEVDFYYERNAYNLTFMNDGTQERQKTILFEADISGENFEPQYPSTLEAGGYVFDGWYTSSTCASGTEFEFTGAAMPANDLMLYAKWAPATHKVEFYLDQASMTKGEKLGEQYPDLEVSHRQKVEAVPTRPSGNQYDNYDFVGWFYLEDGVEKAFDFATMPVTKDLRVYGKWSSNKLADYTVRYVIMNADGSQTEIAAPAVGQALVGHSKTFEAKGGNELYAAYQEGYFPQVPSHTMTIDIDSEKNIYTFVYEARDAVPYTVRYWKVDQNGTVIRDENGNAVEAHAAKTVADNRQAVVTETFEPVAGWMPDAYQKRLVVSTADGALNEIIFYYTEDREHAYYSVTHYIENLEGTGYTPYGEPSQLKGTIGQTYSAEPITIPGFTYNGKVEGTKISGELTAEGLALQLYYTRNSYPYEVRYLEQGTEKKLADATTGEEKYEKLLTFHKKEIPGYTCVSSDPQNMQIQVEENGKAEKNIVTFYYKENEAVINYVAVGPQGAINFGSVSPATETVKVLTGTAAGSTPTAGTNYRFVGWYTDEACTQPVDAKWVDVKNHKLTPQKETVQGVSMYKAATYYAKFELDVADLTIRKTGAAAGDTFIFHVTGDDVDLKVALQGNSSVTLSQLPIGTYTVTEVADWSSRYTPDAASKQIALSGGSNEVTFHNTLRDKWLTFEAFAKNVFNK